MLVHHFGFLANRGRACRPAQIRTALAAPPPEQTPGSEAAAGAEARPCPACRNGPLRVTGQLEPRRALPRPPTGASRRRK